MSLAEIANEIGVRLAKDCADGVFNGQGDAGIFAYLDRQLEHHRAVERAVSAGEIGQLNDMQFMLPSDCGAAGLRWVERKRQ